MIYPTLDFLQDQSLIAIRDEEGGRKQITITEQGLQWLEENQEHLEHIHERIKARSVGFELRKNPQMKSKRTARTVLTGTGYSVGRVIRQGNSSLT